MQVTYRGLGLEQARDMIFDTLVNNHWYALHKGSGRTVAILTTTAARAAEITSELSRLRDWERTEDWEGDVGLAHFAARYPGEVELPGYDDWEGDVPYSTARP